MTPRSATLATPRWLASYEAHTYAAPEMFNADFGMTADVWSVGVSMFTLLMKTHPFADAANPDDLSKTIDCVMHRDVPVGWGDATHLSLELKCIIGMMLERDPVLRITVDEALDML